MSDTRSTRDTVDQARARATSVLGGFTTGQKTTTVLAVAALLLAGMFFMRWVSAPSLVPLFSNMAPADAAAITEELDAQGAAYELADGGSTIMVDRADQAPLRLAMSGAGLMPTGGAGFALLDDHGVTTSEFIQNVDYQRAVEGELATTIGAMDIIDTARVHLVMPDEDLFTQDRRHATASVMLAMRPNATPTPTQVQAIVNLVAGSVEGLGADQVTVTDTAGTMLAAPGEDGRMAAVGDARQQQTASFETRLATSVEAMLQRVVGPDAAVVTVTADLDFDTVARTEETFGNGGPGEGIPLETTITNEEFTGIGAEQTGVLGPDGQILGGGEGEETTYNLEDGSTRFAVDRSVQEILAAPGAVNRLSVAVLMDAQGAGAAADPQAVQAMVEAAVGFDAARGDLVQVTALPFDNAAAEAAEEAAAAAEAAAAQARMYELIRTIGAVLIVLVILLLAWRSARRSMPVREPRSVPIDLSELDVIEEEEDDRYVLAAVNTGPTLNDEVSSMIDSQGDDMAGLLRGWMSEK